MNAATGPSSSAARYATALVADRLGRFLLLFLLFGHLDRRGDAGGPARRRGTCRRRRRRNECGQQRGLRGREGERLRGRGRRRVPRQCGGGCRQRRRRQRERRGRLAAAGAGAGAGGAVALRHAPTAVRGAARCRRAGARCRPGPSPAATRTCPPAVIVTIVVPALYAQNRPDCGSGIGFSCSSSTARGSAEDRLGSTKLPISGREEVKVYSGKIPSAHRLPTQLEGIGMYGSVSGWTAPPPGERLPARGRRASAGEQSAPGCGAAASRPWLRAPVRRCSVSAARVTGHAVAVARARRRRRPGPAGSRSRRGIRRCSPRGS